MLKNSEKKVSGGGKKVISIIPARGGSKRISQKNIRKLCGRPLIAYSIEQSIKCDLIDRTIVSTDDEKIGQISRKYGAEVINRPSELAEDNTPMIDVLKHVVNTLQEKEDYEPDIVVLLQPTSPLREVEDVRKTINLVESGAESAQTFCLVNEHPASMFKIVNNIAAPIDEINLEKRAQDLPVLYKENGAVYVIKKEAAFKNDSFYTKKHKAHIMPRERSIDIYDPVDLILDEALISLRERKAGV